MATNLKFTDDKNNEDLRAFYIYIYIYIAKTSTHTQTHTHKISTFSSSSVPGYHDQYLSFS